MIIYCNLCGKQFNANTIDTRFCSGKCREDFQKLYTPNKLVYKNCSICDKKCVCSPDKPYCNLWVVLNFAFGDKEFI